MEDLTKKFERLSGQHRAWRALVGNPLTLTQLACIYIGRCNDQGRNPRAHEVRKFMYQQHFGSLSRGWHRGWYCDYFRVKGMYTTDHANVGTVYKRDRRGGWHLTAQGRKVRSGAEFILEGSTGARVHRGGRPGGRSTVKIVAPA